MKTKKLIVSYGQSRNIDQGAMAGGRGRTPSLSEISYDATKLKNEKLLKNVSFSHIATILRREASIGAYLKTAMADFFDK